MHNHEIEAAQRYHNGTKHPYGELMDRWHVFDPASQPMLYKIYTDLEPMPLSVDIEPIGVSALAAIATNIGPTDGKRIPNLNALTRILYFSAGITKKLKFQWGEMPFRAAACTGALYHIELYVVCGDLPDLEAGVYHFDPREPALRRLRQGDYRQHLVEATGSEPHVAHAPAVILYTDVFWRNACKYQAREYRHTFWDSGTILANTLAMTAAHELPAKVVAGFIDEHVNRLLDLDTEREVSVALVPVGYDPQMTIGSAPALSSLELEVEPISDYELEFPPIHEMHAASSLTDEKAVQAWQGFPPKLTMPAPSGQLFPLQPYSEDEMSPDFIEPVIMRRGSSRQFVREPITFEQLSTILHQSTQSGVPADFLEAPAASLNYVYLIANAVEGLPDGAYLLHRSSQTLELLKEGDFRKTSGYLGLNQALAADASVNIFFLSDLNPVLERFGNRGYRAAQLEASLTAGRIYLAAYAQELGASGLTFFDDAVIDFFSPHAQDKSVMFMILLGRPAKR